jgi:hypothetical protein
MIYTYEELRLRDNYLVVCSVCLVERQWWRISAQRITDGGIAFICTDCFLQSPTLWQRIKWWFH